MSKTTQEIMLQMSDDLAAGNRNAAYIISELYKVNKESDPDSLFGSLTTIIGFDRFNIKGRDICTLYSKLSYSDVYTVMAWIRAVQLGIIPLRELRSYIRAGHTDVCLTVLVLKVKEILPNFCKETL